MELHGKTILTTRAASSPDHLHQGLRDLGARVLECPTIDIVPIDDWTAVDAAIARLPTYQWILFTSANAVIHFMSRAGSCAVPVAVVGPATAAKLQEWNLHPALMPEEFRAEGLLAAFPADMRGIRILFPRAEVAREILPAELRKRGAEVDVVTVYRTARSTGLEDLRRTLRGVSLDCAVFTSPSSIRYLEEALGEDFKTILAGVPIAVIGPVTRQAAVEAGLSPAIEPEHSTIPDLIAAIALEIGGR